MEPPRKDAQSWDETMMQIAHVISQRSKDPSSQWGSVIADDKNVIVGLGYNGWPRGIANEDLPWDSEGDFADIKNTYVVHAEVNAIYNANQKTTGCRLYAIMFPCHECAKTTIQNGIKEVIYENDRNHDDPSWIASRKMLDAAGVKYRQYRSTLADESERKYYENKNKKTS
jgi:dCMP deaminase